MSLAKKRTIVDGFLWFYFRLFGTVDKQFFRFSMTKKLYGPLAHEARQFDADDLMRINLTRGQLDAKTI